MRGLRQPGGHRFVPVGDRQEKNAVVLEDRDKVADNSRRIWRHVNTLLGENKPRAETCFTAEQYHDVIDKKTADIRAATESAESPSYSNNNTSTWSDLESVTVEDVLMAIGSSSAKQCDYDPLPRGCLKAAR